MTEKTPGPAKYQYNLNIMEKESKVNQERYKNIHKKQRKNVKSDSRLDWAFKAPSTPGPGAYKQVFPDKSVPHV